MEKTTEQLDVTRRVAAILALTILGGCSQAPKSASADPTAGLDSEIHVKWRTDITKTSRLCQSQADGQKCTGFEVACKALRTVTPDDQAKGIAMRVVAAMNFDGFDPKLKQAQSGSEAAEFIKIGPAWTRAAHAPVNLTSCADL
jgi:hypothetical protein